MLGKELARLREVAGIDQQDLADRMGWSQSYQSAIERERRPLSEEAFKKCIATLEVMLKERASNLKAEKAGVG